MQYESAKSQLQSPPNNVSLKGMAFEAAGMLVLAYLLFQLV